MGKLLTSIVLATVLTASVTAAKAKPVYQYFLDNVPKLTRTALSSGTRDSNKMVISGDGEFHVDIYTLITRDETFGYRFFDGSAFLVANGFLNRGDRVALKIGEGAVACDYLSRCQVNGDFTRGEVKDAVDRLLHEYGREE
jgi:hypothetical protein